MEWHWKHKELPAQCADAIRLAFGKLEQAEQGQLLLLLERVEEHSKPGHRRAVHMH